MKNLLVLCVALSVLIMSYVPTKAQESTLVLWTKFDSDNPQDIVDNWLLNTIVRYKKETRVQIVNKFHSFDTINTELDKAIQSGKDVPDISYADLQNIPTLNFNHDLIDITDFVKSASWFNDLDQTIWGPCTRNGRIYCVPTSSSGILVYYWKSSYPDGFPATAQQLLAMDKTSQRFYLVTFKGSEVMSLQATWFPLIASAGGDVSDTNGRATWANPAVVKVVEWARAMFANKDVPDIARLPGFDHEETFKKGQAGAILAGSWSYVYLYPLRAPDGAAFDDGASSLDAAYQAGEVGFAPPLAWEGGTPVVMFTGSAYVIPKTTSNLKSAEDFINFQMRTDENAKYAVAYGSLPSTKSALNAKELQTPYWQAVAKYNQKYARPAPFLNDYDGAVTIFTNAINKLITETDLDIMTELKRTQDQFNSSFPVPQ